MLRKVWLVYSEGEMSWLVSRPRMRTTGSLCSSLGLSLGGRGELWSLMWFSFRCRLEHEPSQVRFATMNWRVNSGEVQGCGPQFVVWCHWYTWHVLAARQTLTDSYTVHILVFHHRHCASYNQAVGVVDGMVTVMVVVAVGTCLNHNSYISTLVPCRLRRHPNGNIPRDHLTCSGAQEASSREHLLEVGKLPSYWSWGAAISRSPSPEILLRRMPFPIQAEIGEVGSTLTVVS